MAKFFCKCGTLALALPGGVRVDIDAALGASQVVCPSCSDVCWNFAAGMRFVDAGLMYPDPQDCAHMDAGIANSISCASCGAVVVLRNGVIDWDVVESPDLTEEGGTSCCGCEQSVVIVPAGYRLRMSVEGKTVSRFPAPSPSHSDWKWPGVE